MMNDFLKILNSRRSCRKFEERPVPRELLEEITRAATNAPSARDRQLWQFTVVTDPALYEELRGAVAQALDRADSYDFYGCPALILCSCEREHPYGREDCACAMENILLAAHSLGLGGVWINQLTATCDTEKVRAVLRSLDVPDSHIVYGSAALGYPDAVPRVKEVRGKISWH